MIDRTNKSWNKEITDEDIYNREFSIGYLIQSNQHLDIFVDLKDKVLSTYKVTATFSYLGYNGHQLYCNNQCLIRRGDKFGGLELGKDVILIDYNLNVNGGGSHKWPSIAFKGAFCTLEFMSYGLPFVDKTNGWGINIKSMIKVI